MKNDVEQYLNSVFNAELYHEITERKLFKSEEQADLFFIKLFNGLGVVKENKFKSKVVSKEIMNLANAYSGKLQVEFYEYLLRILINEYNETLHLSINSINKVYIKLKNDLGIQSSFNAVDEYFREHHNFYLDPVGPGITWSNQKMRGRDPDLFLRNEDIKDEVQSEVQPKVKKNDPNTAHRQALALHYLDKLYGFNTIGDKTKLARFAAFLTGKNYDNLYDYFKDPLKYNTPKREKEDLEYVREQFEQMGNDEIIKLIDKDLKSIL